MTAGRRPVSKRECSILRVLALSAAVLTTGLGTAQPLPASGNNEVVASRLGSLPEERNPL